jgi:hypothetical protein
MVYASFDELFNIQLLLTSEITVSVTDLDQSSKVVNFDHF